ncbi:hypothetical protein AYX14_07185 [Cryptococcus neoformans]|nr:hypothetical protein AYX14_07185 [Cryptococcus neoformans var. grubii]
MNPSPLIKAFYRLTQGCGVWLRSPVFAKQPSVISLVLFPST